ncbi:GIY-YIG nuclease family protein [Algoriphagus namhaensis]|uniref:GIY-YIG nuclease family protein n=1 Tax=Algoriphagus namhaensis TaxID=915353 RepID=A0ABV8ASS8_9BACT
MEYFVYFIESKKDGTFYFGSSTDPKIRLAKHNKPHKGYTAMKQPWKLKYTQRFDSIKEAIVRERFLKAQKSRVFLSEHIINQSKD